MNWTKVTNFFKINVACDQSCPSLWWIHHCPTNLRSIVLARELYHVPSCRIMTCFTDSSDKSCTSYSSRRHVCCLVISALRIIWLANLRSGELVSTVRCTDLSLLHLANHLLNIGPLAVDAWLSYCQLSPDISPFITWLSTISVIICTLEVKSTKSSNHINHCMISSRVHSFGWLINLPGQQQRWAQHPQRH